MAAGSIMLVWAMCYQLSVGTVCYSLVGEMATRRLQIKTIVLGRSAYNVIGIICSVLSPYMINPTAWNWGLFTGFFWAGFCFLCIIYTFFRIPEPTGRTFAELDLLFERGVSARKFAKTEVDVFGEHVGGEEVMQQYERKMSTAAASHDEKDNITHEVKMA